MANVAKIKDLIISSGGSYTIESLSNYKEANITFSVGSIASNLSINPAVNAIGTIKGLRFTIHYDGSFVAFGNFTVTIFGTVMNNNLRDKKLLIDLYYDGMNWRATFTPSFETISSILKLNNVIYNDFSNYISANTGAPQTLTTFNIPKSLFKVGDHYRIKVSGDYNTTNLKNLRIILSDGVNSTDLINRNVSFNNKPFNLSAIIYCTDFVNGFWQREEVHLANTELPIIRGDNGSPSLDFSTNWTCSIIATEFTPTGNQISIKKIIVEKFLVP